MMSWQLQFVLLLCGVFFGGCLFGVTVTLIINHIISKKSKEMFDASINEVTGVLKDSFSDISLETLSKTTDHMIKLASEKLSSEREISVKTTEHMIKLASEKLTAERELSAKEVAGQKQAIEARIQGLNTELARLTDLVNTLESRRSSQMGELKQAIDTGNTNAAKLYSAANNLNQVLSSKQSRGQWGERMAEDILASAGLKQGINYLCQNRELSGNRPDFTFLLPNGMKLNMDVKFPFENYRRYLESSSGEGSSFKQAFIKDVKNHIKTVSGRGYIDPEENTLDCVLLFIPNENIYSFIFECDPAIMDEASQKKVLICSPVTIMSVLAVIRQAADNFIIEKNAKALMQAIGVFRKEWIKYSESLDKIGGYIDKAASEYRELTVTRSKKLSSSISKLESIHQENEIEFKSN